MAKETAKTQNQTEQRAGVRRQEVVGEVISDKMDKTITVQVYRRVRHAKYGKFLKKTSVYKAHDETNQAKVGDKVLIQMTRPLSKTKRWRLLEIVEKGEQDLGGVNV
ncbi:MAG: 30S ribosomal protein S17 [Calothrix sp. SM1_5_4]|nr:30S ribosomal protein S17 [Calothrix sp. SM1_5_4]